MAQNIVRPVSMIQQLRSCIRFLPQCTNNNVATGITYSSSRCVRAIRWSIYHRCFSCGHAARTHPAVHALYLDMFTEQTTPSRQCHRWVYVETNIQTRALWERKPLPTPKFQPKVIRDSNPDCRIDPDPDLSQNVVDALSCRRQSFRQVWYKSAVDCMRNANKCPKIPYSPMVKKIKKWSGIHTRFRITTKS